MFLGFFSFVSNFCIILGLSFLELGFVFCYKSILIKIDSFSSILWKGGSIGYVLEGEVGMVKEFVR